MISVVIPNWNGKKFLGPCINSLLGQTHKDFEIILVDNGSDDGSVEFVREHYPRVRIAALPSNMGFPAACNEGIRNSRGDLIALLNNDTEADPGWLMEMEKVLISRDDAGLCAPKVLLLAQKDAVDSVGTYFRSNGIAGSRRSMEPDTAGDPVEEVLGACGGAVLLRGSMLKDTGIFDEDLFAYYEDIDLSLRAQLAGYKCVTAPLAVVYHHGSGTSLSILLERGRPTLPSSCNTPALTRRASGQTNDFIVYWGTRSRLNCILKNLPLALLLRYSFEMFIAEIWLLLRCARMGRMRPFFEGRLDSLKELPRTLKKRREIQNKRKVTVSYLRSIITEAGLGYYRRRILAELRPATNSGGLSPPRK